MLIPSSRLPIALAAGLVALAALAAASLALGSFPVTPRELASVLGAAISGGASGVGDNTRAIVLEVRGPRILAALAGGAALGASGAAFQNAFRNPLVSPDILGVSSGCALGAVVGILAGLPAAAMQGLAFTGGLAAAGLAREGAGIARGRGARARGGRGEDASARDRGGHGRHLGRGRGRRRDRLGGARGSACRAPARGTELRARAAALGIARRGVPRGRRHVVPHPGGGRAASRSGDRDRGHPGLHRASRRFLAARFVSLAAQALAYGYPGRVVGRGLDLALGAGEVVCVLGPNGAGKTTLLRTLLGLIPALAGRLTVANADVASVPRAEMARKVAYVPQAMTIAFDFTLLDIVEMGRTAHLGPFAGPSRRDLDRARNALDRLGIGALAGRPMGAVSGGERPLPLIARALATQATYLLMDEPTANLAFVNQALILDQVAALTAGA